MNHFNKDTVFLLFKMINYMSTYYNDVQRCTVHYNIIREIHIIIHFFKRMFQASRLHLRLAEVFGLFGGHKAFQRPQQDFFNIGAAKCFFRLFLKNMLGQPGA